MFYNNMHCTDNKYLSSNIDYVNLFFGSNINGIINLFHNGIFLNSFY